MLSAQPSLDAHQIVHRQITLAMSVGDTPHYRMDTIAAHHFFQTGEKAGLSKSLVREAIEDVAAGMDKALTALEAELPGTFPQSLHDSVKSGIQTRLRVLDGC